MQRSQVEAASGLPALRRPLHLLMLLGLFLLCATGAQAASTQEAIRATLLTRQASQPADAPTDPVYDFYAARAFRPAWTGSAAAEDGATTVAFTLAHADSQGLRPGDYASSRWDTPPEEGVEAAAYELDLTTDLLHYARDVRQGRVRPGQVYTDISLPARTFDFAGSLSRALKARDIEIFLADLPPPQPEYQGLVMALMNYRRLATSGGLPVVPGKGEIALDGKQGVMDARARALILRLALEDPELAGSEMGVEDVRAAILRFQARNGINPDGRAGLSTLAALNVPVAARIGQILANMERWRWMPRNPEPRYIRVNVPDQSVQFVANGEVALESRAIVGRLTSKTPIARLMAQQLVANPPWHVPDDIAAASILPQLQRSPDYLKTRNMVLVNGPADDPHGLKINWRKMKKMPYWVDQNPGDDSAMGVLMLDSPNDFGVYLHDTPGKALFKPDLRLKSNGCIRVEQMLPLASLVLSGDAVAGMDQVQEAIASGQTQRLALEQPLPVYLVYWTAVASPDGRVGFRPDLYGRDKPLISALSAPRRTAS